MMTAFFFLAVQFITQV